MKEISIHQSPNYSILLQMLCVNKEKVVSSRKYGGAGILPGDA